MSKVTGSTSLLPKAICLLLLLLAVLPAHGLAQQPKPEPDPLDKAADDRLQEATQNLQAFFDARKSTVRWGTQSKRRVTVLGRASGKATLRFEFVWAEGASGAYWKEVVAEFELSGQDWQLAEVICRTPIRGPIDRTAKTLVQEIDLLKVLAEEKGLGYWLKEGRAKAKAGKWDEAITDLTKAIELEPLAAMPWNERGIAHLRKGQADRALADFSKAIELRPNDHVLWTNRADAHGKMGQWDKTIADAVKAIELKGDFEIAWLLRGSAHASLGQWEKALEDFAKAATFPKASKVASSHGALVHLQLKDPKSYRQACARLLDEWAQGEDPKEAALVAWTCSASPESAVKLGRIIEVLEKSNPSDYVSLRALGAALYRSGKSQEAIKTFTKVIESRKQPSPSAWIYLAMTHHQLGQEDDARQWLEKAKNWVATARKQAPEVKQQDKLSWHNLPWNERLTLELSLREAEDLLNSK
jgi:tetratricopeptide (TPR) repeat protein